MYRRNLQWAEEVIGAVNADEEDARVLQTSAGNALLHIRETTYDTQHVPIEYSVSLLRADRYTASVISVRKANSPLSSINIPPTSRSDDYRHRFSR